MPPRPWKPRRVSSSQQAPYPSCGAGGARGAAAVALVSDRPAGVWGRRAADSGTSAPGTLLPLHPVLVQSCPPMLRLCPSLQVLRTWSYTAMRSVEVTGVGSQPYKKWNFGPRDTHPGSRSSDAGGRDPATLPQTRELNVQPADHAGHQPLGQLSRQSDVLGTWCLRQVTATLLCLVAYWRVTTRGHVENAGERNTFWSRPASGPEPVAPGPHLPAGSRW